MVYMKIYSVTGKSSSQVSTPQMDIKYDAQLQNLQQQLSSIPVNRTQSTVSSLLVCCFEN